MKKFVSIFKNKEIVNRIFFTIMILFVVRIGDCYEFFYIVIFIGRGVVFVQCIIAQYESDDIIDCS